MAEMFERLDWDALVKIYWRDDLDKNANDTLQRLRSECGGGIVEVSSLIWTFARGVTYGENYRYEYLKHGLPCETLRLGDSQWRRGKIRITIEFAPDAIDYPLDEIRKENEQ